MKKTLKLKAILLRKKGFSYSEILQQVPVAKSTLSLWLRSVHLAKKQKQQLTQKKLLAIQKGWEARKKQRIEKRLKLNKKLLRKFVIFLKMNCY